VFNSVDFTTLNSLVKMLAMPRDDEPLRPAPAGGSRRTGRRPGASGSRAAILAAAQRLFAEHGYSGTSLRAIGAEAGVDAALIVHFFGSKAELLTEAVRWPFDPAERIPELLARGRHHVGEELARLFVTTWDRAGDRDAIMTLLRAATTEPAAAELMATFVRDGLFAPLTAALGIRDEAQAGVRGSLAASQLVGLGIARYVLRLAPLAAMSADEVVAWLAPTLQRYLTGRAP
jgi:AcrR family transcriptional regulator